MRNTVKTHTDNRVDVCIVNPISDEITIKRSKNTICAMNNNEVIVVEPNSFTLYTNKNYTVDVQSDKDRDLPYAGVNIEELHHWLADSEALFEIDTVYVYVNSLKRTLVVYLTDDAEILRNDYT